MYSIRICNRNVGEDCFEILKKYLTEKFEDRGLVVTEQDADCVFSFGVEPSWKDDRYMVEKHGKEVVFTSASKISCFASAGAYMNASVFDGRGGFVPSEEKIDFTPADPLRGMYYATHFHNFYQNAPMHELFEVTVDLAFRGCNAILQWFDMHHYTSMQDPAASYMVTRIKQLYAFAEKIGMNTALLMLANEAFSSSPAALRAENIRQNAYHTRPEDHFGVEICPNKKGGMEEILKERREMLEVFRGTKVNYLVYWPYDQGGCTCKDCAPWGSGGFLKILPEFRKLTSEMMPESRIIISTWYFDRFIDGEWEQFSRHMEAGDLGEVDYIMSFFRHGNVPACLSEELMKRYRFISFPEISMESCMPWGGFGASTLLESLQKTNESCAGMYSGGFPYSEGIYEDINKAVMLGWYSGTYRTADAALRAYLSFEFCVHGKELDELCDAVYKLDKGLPREMDFLRGEEPKYLMECTEYAPEAAEVFEKNNRQLPEKIRSSRKFRLLYLRAIIDREMVLNGGCPARSEICEAAMKEVNELYYADELTEYQVRAPYGEDPLKYPTLLCFRLRMEEKAKNR